MIIYVKLKPLPHISRVTGRSLSVHLTDKAKTRSIVHGHSIRCTDIQWKGFASRMTRKKMCLVLVFE